MDFQGLQAGRLHDELGMNVAFPALPLHGPRRVTLVSGEPFLSFEMMNAVHGLTQAVWDIRRLIQWIRAKGATSISLYGVSLGAYTVSLLAGLEAGHRRRGGGHPRLGLPRPVPPAQSPRHPCPIDRAQDHGRPAENVYRVVSPMSFEAKVRKAAGSSSRATATGLAPPDQALRLWEHWDQPRISWYSGGPRRLPVVEAGLRLSRQLAASRPRPAGATEVGGG
jgi:hypothetical protein